MGFLEDYILGVSDEEEIEENDERNMAIGNEAVMEKTKRSLKLRLKDLEI